MSCLELLIEHTPGCAFEMEHRKQTWPVAFGTGDTVQRVCTAKKNDVTGIERHRTYGPRVAGKDLRHECVILLAGPNGRNVLKLSTLARTAGT
ncbi:MAG: hypothetical protein ACI9DC_002503 [Gammaproteobacteria bacterium]|jgi:hypothetical protein